MGKRVTKKVGEEGERVPSGRGERGEKPTAPKPLNKIMIAGKEYPCRVTMGALLRFKRATGHDVSSMDYEDMEELMVFIHSCVVSACKVDGVEFGLDVMDMADLIDPAALEDFYSAMDGGERGEEGESPEAEKKTVRERE